MEPTGSSNRLLAILANSITTPPSYESPRWALTGCSFTECCLKVPCTFSVCFAKEVSVAVVRQEACQPLICVFWSACRIRQILIIDFKC